MKSAKLLLIFFITGFVFTSCKFLNDEYSYEIPLEEVLSEYDLWYVDYHKTTGTGDVPFLSKAFTVSFFNGQFYANNNIVDIGLTGDGLGIKVGNYNTYNGYLEIDHSLDGAYDFDVFQISANEIRIEDTYNNVSYYLVGYQRNNFDYDRLFYENIEYFLQEYVAWEKTSTSNSGAINPFDEETFLQFTPENNTTFYSSKDPFGTNIDIINWSFVGSYNIYDVQNYNDLKILTLNYDSGDNEEFELSVINDNKIRLYHVSSQTTYKFKGRGFIQFLKGGKAKSNVRNNGRKRTKIQRETKVRRHLK
ncbi:hypothetical protein KCTC32516_00768 [Polaribacter huanghezhanensis]|uniref:hypothetical protein n=1 Tax=Polaribacter huanghezhanensis TaxID=1354726 RepID=UPI00264A1EAD|nr:hypothetical protein [Polaribacter huanghezhanensis]WKD85428.1 hypothetical protein KCTC32516_00768 [Polaribacter huanghezhanensis]